MSKATETPTTGAAAPVLPALTSYQSAVDTIDALAVAVMGCADQIGGAERAPLARAACDLLQVATGLRLRQELAGTDKDEGGGETVTSCYAAWLLERGAALEGSGKAEGDGKDAWSFAVKSFGLPARESYEIGYKVEMADWIFSSGDPGPRTRRTVFAGIAADLEG